MVLSLPRMGERPMMTEARADLTCWLASDTSSWEEERRDIHGVGGQVTPNPTKPERSLLSPCHSGAGDSPGYQGNDFVSPLGPQVLQTQGGPVQRAGNSVCIWLSLKPHPHPFFLVSSRLLYVPLP